MRVGREDESAEPAEGEPATGSPALLVHASDEGRALRRPRPTTDTELMHWLIVLVPLAAAFLLHNPTLNTALLTVLARGLALVGSQKDESTSDAA